MGQQGRCAICEAKKGAKVENAQCGFKGRSKVDLNFKIEEEGGKNTGGGEVHRQGLSKPPSRTKCFEPKRGNKRVFPTIQRNTRETAES